MLTPLLVVSSASNSKHYGVNRMEISKRIFYLLLTIYYAKVLHGNTRLQKILFVLTKELSEKHNIETGYTFEAYYFGPFSIDIYRDLDSLQMMGFVEKSLVEIPAKDRVISYPEYKVTSLGSEIVRKIIQTKFKQRDLDFIKSIIEELNNLPLNELIRRVYLKYPEYTKNSIIKEDLFLGSESN